MSEAKRPTPEQYERIEEIFNHIYEMSETWQGDLEGPCVKRDENGVWPLAFLLPRRI